MKEKLKELIEKRKLKFTSMVSSHQLNEMLDNLLPEIEKLFEERKREVREDRDSAWRAYLQKATWLPDEIDVATTWVERTPLRLRANYKLEKVKTITNKE